MGDGSVEQFSFLGGEFSPYAQGRMDTPNYKIGLNLCQNGLPLEEGAWVRRSGTCEFGITNMMRPGVIREFLLPDGNTASLEFTYASGASALRIWVRGNYGADGASAADVSLITTNGVTISAISTATPAVVETSAAQTWATGTQAVIYMDPTVGVTNAPTLRNRQFTLTKIDTTHFSLVDNFTGANVNGSTLGVLSLGTSYIDAIQVMTLPYTTLAAVKAVQVTQENNTLYISSPGYTTQVLTVYPTYTAGAITNLDFVLTTIDFSTTDGPYLDPPLYPSGGSQTNSSLAYVVKGADWDHLTFTITDGGYTFTSADVGKGIRIWTQPPPYTAGDTYGVGNVCTYAGAFWSSAVSFSYMTASVTPGSQGSDTKGIVWNAWAPDPLAGQWLSGKIASYSSGTTVDIVITSTPGGGVDAGTLLELNGSFEPRNSSYYTDGGATIGSTTGAMIDTYRIGAFGNGVYPACSGLYEGRIIFGGAISNRFDMSMNGQVPGAPIMFSPTDSYGDVLDTSGISYTISGSGENQIQWFLADVSGVIVSTSNKEYLIDASVLSDPITPTSIQARPSTSYRASVVQAIHVGQAVLFVQKDQQKIFEYIWGAAFSPHKFVGKHLNEFAKHLSSSGLNELAYTEEKAPVVWTYNNNGLLIGCTYRRVSTFVTEAPLFNGWHEHPLGSGRNVISLCHCYGLAGNVDGITLITQDPNTGYCYVEMPTGLFDEDWTCLNAWYVDSSPPPATGIAGTDSPVLPPSGGGAGKFYFEVTITDPGPAAFCVGIANSSFNLTNPQELDYTPGPESGLAGGVFQAFSPFHTGTNNAAGNAWSGLPTRPASYGSFSGSTQATNPSAPLTLGVVVDTVNKLMWWTGNWYASATWIGVSGSGSPDPVAEVQGYPIGDCGIATTDQIYILLGCGDESGSLQAGTLNTGASSWVMSLPSTCTAWDSSGATVMNSGDAAAAIILSGGGLDVTSGTISGANQPTAFVRSNTSKAQ